jgi:hypothetical protein
MSELSSEDFIKLAQASGLLETPEELDDELAEHLEYNESLGLMLRHPLLYCVPYSEHWNGMLNRSLQQKKEQLARALRQKNWNQFVFLYEKPYRINAFADICWRMGDTRYWPLLASIWTNSENLHQNEGLWIDCLTAQRRYRSHMMDAAERATLRLYPPRDIPIYRGFSVDGREEGLSWTVNRVTAKFFAGRFAQDGDTPRIASGTVSRRHVIAYLSGRSEDEFIVLPHNVRDMEITEVPRRHD